MDNQNLTDDEEYDDNILELEDDEGNVEKYLHIGTIEYKGEWYWFFQKAEPETEEEEDEVVMFLLKGEGDEQELLPLEDETLMDEVFAEFCNQYEQYEDSEDAKKLDGAEDWLFFRTRILLVKFLFQKSLLPETGKRLFQKVKRNKFGKGRQYGG